MQNYQLESHPGFSPLAVKSVEAKWGITGQWLQLRWRVEGAGRLILPQYTGRQRRDGLWEATCFEMFLRGKDRPAYAEFNFSPSESWAAYDFTDWREGRSERSVSHDPVVTPRGEGALFFFDVAIPLYDLPELPAALSLPCVIEEEGGVKSFWAMNHGDPGAPNFHDAACFAATLEAPEDT